MDPNLTVAQRRQAFVRDLYGLHYAITSANPRRSGEARQKLARLRRSFAGQQQEAEAYDVVFPHEPPIREQDLWLLVAGLFALHPHADTVRGRSLGTAMQELVEERPSAARRFTQLLSVDVAAMPHYLRQAIQLLRSAEVAIDYLRLLTDLAEMRQSREEAHRIRLSWARDYHRPKRRPKPDQTLPIESDPTADAAAEPVDA
ncbi:type I-E CRISPR-associated protein Cse2/CasB [Micromonospora chalcea]|uniref:type I-E CRISPR-associated protein Cse2/CasB n=1 Tax=Micromonospora TaxID=1873 RepID=UPI0013BBD044|nr:MULTISPECIES: type I-E CRISPR-associated protein Cse2/CasB [unclassified Micromonospora]MBQ1053449.1 type I-E CRISPR-associated protein Cse2/CasB [Micromonospora sp. C32]MBQ1061985.1 type I-E CRISPR-associated protein Cse2/CasB [Micromonospora sp. C41]NED50197.1 type I-E CRISPR-associated protein Cse2/CasB [Micromonospora aurantiaca]